MNKTTQTTIVMLSLLAFLTYLPGKAKEKTYATAPKSSKEVTNELKDFDVDTYCQPETINDPATRFITKVAFQGTLNDVENNSSYATTNDGYEDFTSLANVSRQAQGEGVNITVEGNARGKWLAWVDWNQDGLFDDATEIVYNAGTFGGLTTTFGFVIPEDATPGDYTIRIRLYNSMATMEEFGGSTVENFGMDFTACEPFDTYEMYFYGANRTFYEYGEAEDYTFTVLPSCSAEIKEYTEATNCGEGSVVLSVVGSSDTTSYLWYDAETGGNLVATTTENDWVTPELSQTTTYYVTAFNGSCESYQRTAVTAYINPIPTLKFSPDNPTVCGEDDVFAISAQDNYEQVFLVNENFETGDLGVFTNTNNDENSGTIDNATQWKNKTSTIIIDGTTWKPAISSGFGEDQFVLASSDLSNIAPTEDINNYLTLSAPVNTTDFISLTLEFNLFYSRNLPNNSVTLNEYFSIEVSTDNGASWNTIESYTQDVGTGTKFSTIQIDLSSYIDEENFNIKFNHYSHATPGGWLPDGAAIDDVHIYGDKILNPSFSWEGSSVDAFLDEACTIPYTEGDYTDIVYVKPTLEQLELESFDFTASTMLANGCFANTAIEITNNSKIWQANTDDWTDPNNWLPFGIPGDENCVIVKDNFSAEIPDGIHGKAKQFKVKNGGTATIKGNGVLTVHEEVIVEEEGIFTIENNGSLIQTTEAENTGAILVNRNASISKYDYVYWSSPLAPMVIDSLSPNTSSAYIYEWIPTIANSFGNWSNASGNMEIGKGYIIRAPNNYPVNIDQLFTANFTGTPNNGTITQTVQRGSYTGEDYQNSYGTTVTKYDDNQNLVGNPYPSAISADLFLQVNTNLEGAIELWTHGNDPSTASEASFYESFTYNYDASDYITYNATGASSGPASFDGYIASGQAFFVTMIDGETSTESITFTNDMRSNLYDNSQFFRMNTSETPSTTTTEGHIWLDLINNQNENVDRTLVGYIEGATNEKDRIYDAVTNLNTSLSIYSIINNNSLGIQGRALPFTSSDVVNLGIKTPQTGSYTIAIASTDGLFSTTEQEIYIEDLVLNTTHNLSNSPYNFTINTVGNIQERFILKFTDATMGNASVTRKETIIKATSLNPETIKVHSSLTPLSNIQIYDVTGKLIKEINHIEENAVLIPIQKTNSTLLLHISDSNQHIINRKIIH